MASGGSVQLLRHMAGASLTGILRRNFIIGMIYGLKNSRLSGKVCANSNIGSS